MHFLRKHLHTGSFPRHQHWGRWECRGGILFFPLGILNFNTDSADKSQDNLLENRLRATEIDLYMYMYVKLILVRLWRDTVTREYLSIIPKTFPKGIFMIKT